MILGIDHVGVAVTDAAQAAQTFSRLVGSAAGSIDLVAEQGVRVCFVPAEATPRLELLAALAPGSAVGRFLERRGEGLHHVCYAVDDIHAELARLKGAGFQLVDEEPRPGHGGQVAFVHPRSAHGVLIELLQRT